MTKNIIPDGEPYTVPFKGKPIWISTKKKYIMFYPILGAISQADIEEMCLVMDIDKTTDNRTFSFQKIAKGEFFKFFGMTIDCEHDFIIMRLFIEEEDGKFTEHKLPHDDEDHVKVCLLKLPKGSIKALPINLNNTSKGLN